MNRDQNRHKIVFIAGLILVAIASLGGYLYNNQKSEIRAISDESRAKQQSLSEELDQSRQEIDRLEGRIQQLDQERSTLQQGLAQEQSAREQLRKELEAAREASKQVELAMREELQQMAEVGSELEMDLRRQLQEQKLLDSRLDTVSGEKDQLESRLASEQERRRQLQQQIDEVSGDVSQKENALADAETALSQLNSQLAQNRGEQEQLKSQIDEVSRQREQDSQHFAELEQRLKNELNESRFEISQLKNRMTVIKLTSEVLFRSGSARIKPAGQEVLSVIAESLNSYPDRDINIEGHTDSVPIGSNSRYRSNWELSAARALAAVDHLQQNNRIDPKRLKVVGYGEHHPVASNDTAEGRQLNRRIEIKLLPTPIN